MFRQLLNVENRKLVIELPESFLNTNIEILIKSNDASSNEISDLKLSKDKLRELIEMEYYNL